MEVIKQTSTETLVVTKCWCGITHGVPKSLYDSQRSDFDNGYKPKSIYCPLGHEWVPSGEPEYKRLERKLQQERAAADQREAGLKEQRDRAREDRDHAEHRRRAEKAAKTRIKNRVAKGVCPCCNRHFENLAGHMKTKHPEYADAH